MKTHEQEHLMNRNLLIILLIILATIPTGHAGWTHGTTNIVGFWDGTNVTPTLLKDWANKTNMSLTGSTYSYNGTDGTYFYVPSASTGNYVNISTVPISGNQWTFCMDFLTNTSPVQYQRFGYFGTDATGKKANIYFYFTTAAQAGLGYYGAFPMVQADAPVAANWQEWCFVGLGNNTFLSYVNGTYKQTNTPADTINITAGDTKLFAADGTAYAGMISKLAFFNTSLNSSQISDWYDLGRYGNPYTNGTSPAANISITITSPAENTDYGKNGQTSANISYSINKNGNCWYKVNSGSNTTTTCANGTNSINATNLNITNNTITIWANDSTGTVSATLHILRGGWQLGLTAWYPLRNNFTNIVNGQNASVRNDGSQPLSFTNRGWNLTNWTQAKSLKLGNELDGATSWSWCTWTVPQGPSYFGAYGNQFSIYDPAKDYVYFMDFTIPISVPGPANRLITGTWNAGNGYSPSGMWVGERIIPPGAEYHFCGVKDATRELLWMNGELVRNATNGTGVPANINCDNSTNNCQFFNSDGRDNNQHVGYVHDAMLWVNHTISEQDVLNIYALYQDPVNVTTTGFDGTTTDFSSINASAADNPVIQKIGTFKIEWNGENLDFAQNNFTKYLKYGKNSIWLDSQNLTPDVNTSALLTFYDTGYYGAPNLKKDGAYCTTCTLITSTGDDHTFNVTSFSNYTMNGSNSTLGDGLIAYFKFSNTSGSDREFNQINNVPMNCSTGCKIINDTSIRDNVLNISGTAAYTTTAIINGTTGTGTGMGTTISFWINRKSAGTRILMSPTTMLSYNADHGLYMNSTNGEQNFSKACSPDLNAWNHFTMTLNGSHFLMYKNGTYCGTNSTPISKGWMAITGIGSSSSSMVMQIDELAVWNRTLLPIEITRLYNYGRGLVYPFNSTNNTFLTYNSINNSALNSYCIHIKEGSTTIDNICSNANGTAQTSASGTYNVTYYNFSEGNYANRTRQVFMSEQYEFNQSMASGTATLRLYNIYNELIDQTFTIRNGYNTTSTTQPLIIDLLNGTNSIWVNNTDMFNISNISITLANNETSTSYNIGNISNTRYAFYLEDSGIQVNDTICLRNNTGTAVTYYNITDTWTPTGAQNYVCSGSNTYPAFNFTTTKSSMTLLVQNISIPQYKVKLIFNVATNGTIEQVNTTQRDSPAIIRSFTPATCWNNTDKSCTIFYSDLQPGRARVIYNYNDSNTTYAFRQYFDFINGLTTTTARLYVEEYSTQPSDYCYVTLNARNKGGQSIIKDVTYELYRVSNNTGDATNASMTNRIISQAATSSTVWINVKQKYILFATHGSYELVEQGIYVDSTQACNDNIWVQFDQPLMVGYDNDLKGVFLRGNIWNGTQVMYYIHDYNTNNDNVWSITTSQDNHTTSYNLGSTNDALIGAITTQHCPNTTQDCTVKFYLDGDLYTTRTLKYIPGARDNKPEKEISDLIDTSDEATKNFLIIALWLAVCVIAIAVRQITTGGWGYKTFLFGVIALMFIQLSTIFIVAALYSLFILIASRLSSTESQE